MNPLYVGAARLGYIGNRPYVHGTTMFVRIVEALAGIREGAIWVTQFNVKRELRKQDGIIEVTAHEPNKSTRPLFARLDGRVGENTIVACMYEDATREITVRDPEEREKHIVRTVTTTGDFSGRATLVNTRGLYDLIRGIVEANKQIHVATLNGRNPAIRWVYLKELGIPQESDASRLTVEFQHRSALSHAGARFTKSRFQVSGLPEPLEGEMCFKYDEPASEKQS